MCRLGLKIQCKDKEGYTSLEKKGKEKKRIISEKSSTSQRGSVSRTSGST